MRCTDYALWHPRAGRWQPGSVGMALRGWCRGRAHRILNWHIAADLGFVLCQKIALQKFVTPPLKTRPIDVPKVARKRRRKQLILREFPVQQFALGRAQLNGPMQR